MEVELRAVFGGTAGSHGYGMQDTRAVSADGSGGAVRVGCAGCVELVIYMPSNVLRSTGLCLKLDSISIGKSKG